MFIFAFPFQCCEPESSRFEKSEKVISSKCRRGIWRYSTTETHFLEKLMGSPVCRTHPWMGSSSELSLKYRQTQKIFPWKKTSFISSFPASSQTCPTVRTNNFSGCSSWSRTTEWPNWGREWTALWKHQKIVKWMNKSHQKSQDRSTYRNKFWKNELMRTIHTFMGVIMSRWRAARLSSNLKYFATELYDRSYVMRWTVIQTSYLYCYNYNPVIISIPWCDEPFIEIRSIASFDFPH